MTTRITSFIAKSEWSILPLALLAGLVAVAPVQAADDAAANDAIEQAHDAHGSHNNSVPAKLVELVRNATQQFIDVNMATAANYHPAFGCVTGPDHGAMGVHYLNGTYVGDGLIDVNHPEALIYEPTASGMRLVGVEFIVDAATWLTAHHNTPPVLEGQAFQFVGSPNRFGIPAFFELHVWAWRNNPNGAFVDWNTRVTCENQ